MRHKWPQFDGDKVLEWRADQLLDAGLKDDQAAFLALMPIDLHEACDRARWLLARTPPANTASSRQESRHT